MYNRDNYNLYLMGKDKIEWMYHDSHTTIKEVFKERMNRARNDYLRSSKNANTVFQSYMNIKDIKKIEIIILLKILNGGLNMPKTHI